MTSRAVSLHYFELPRTKWELMLTRVRQLGADTIVTPVPWGFHQFAENNMDLAGLTNPRRDVVGFARLCAAMGFRLRLELSPVVTEAGILLNGLPGWLLKKHPELRQRNADNQPTPFPVWEHSAFLKALGAWWQALSGALLPLPESTFAQLMALPVTTDFSAQTANVQWPIFLRKKYADGGIDALNAVYAPPTPFNSFNHVKLAAAIPADAQEFCTFVATHARETYAGLLAELGWTLAEPEALPPHAVQLPATPADVGATLRHAMQAPIRADGTPTADFWAQKESNTLTALSAEPAAPQILINSPTDAVRFELTEQRIPFRLRLDGGLEMPEIETRGEKTVFPAVAVDEHGQTDIYFTLPTAETPIDGDLAQYLRSLVVGQQHALASVQQLIAQLDTALTPDASPAPSAAPPPELSEAHAALSEANLALRRAAASIGALEDAFATALDTPPAQSAALEFLALEKDKLVRVKSACENALFAISQMPDPTLAETITVETYRQSVQAINAVAEIIESRFGDSLQWLRAELALGNLSTSAWSVHTKIETLLQLLTNGVLRK